MTHKTDMREALQLCIDAMLHDGVPTDPYHPRRVALNAAEAALASRPDAQAGERYDLLQAAVNCPHEIESNRVVLHYSDKQPGHNALAQLHERLARAATLASQSAGVPGWMPIDTAPKTGRTLLLGYPNVLGKWRTTRGQWMSENYIAEYWEDPDDAEPGWYETSVEAEDIPNCWFIEPTHWMPLPAAPDAAPSPDREQAPYSAPFTTDVPHCCGEPETCNDPCDASPSRECEERPAENAGVRNKIAAALHYPDHWDTAAYPTLDDAAWEAIAAAKLTCSECGGRQGLTIAAVIEELRQEGERDAIAIIKRLAASAPTLVETVTPSNEELMRLLTEYEGALQSEDEDEIAPARNALLAFLRPIRERLEAASAPALGDGEVAARAKTVHRRIDALCEAANTAGADYFDASTSMLIATRDLLTALGFPHRMDAPQSQAVEPKGMMEEQRNALMRSYFETIAKYLEADLPGLALNTAEKARAFLTKGE